MWELHKLRIAMCTIMFTQGWVKSQKYHVQTPEHEA